MLILIFTSCLLQKILCAQDAFNKIRVFCSPLLFSSFLSPGDHPRFKIAYQPSASLWALIVRLLNEFDLCGVWRLCDVAGLGYNLVPATHIPSTDELAAKEAQTPCQTRVGKEDYIPWGS